MYIKPSRIFLIVFPQMELAWSYWINNVQYIPHESFSKVALLTTKIALNQIIFGPRENIVRMWDVCTVTEGQECTEES